MVYHCLKVLQMGVIDLIKIEGYLAKTFLECKGRRQHSKPLAVAKMLQHSTATWGFSYVSLLHLAAENVGCSQLILMCP